MATTTPNFGWDIPQSTDLVKDGATAIAALGNDIDTSMVDLKGGTTGQVLSKASNTDMDFTWVAQDDSNAIQNTIVDAKGDIITATAADTPARLAVGSNGQTLVADSSQTTGLGWVTPIGSLSNPVINGAFDIWQRGTSIAGSAGLRLYTADRWQMPSNAAQTISRQTTGDTTNLPNIQYCARLQRNASSTDTGNVQIIQSMESTNAIPFAGKAVTFSFYARRGSNFSATSNAFGFVFNTGTGTDQNLYNGYTGNVETITNFTATTTWQRFVVNATIPATATEIGYYPYFSPTGTAGANDYLEVTGFQIDLGTYTASTAPAFRRSGGTIQGELAACQRYFQRLINGADSTNELFVLSQCYATTAGSAPLRFNTTMRTAPTMTISSTSHFAAADVNGIDKTLTSATISAATIRSLRFNFEVASGLTTGSASYVRSINASSTLDLSAEL